MSLPAWHPWFGEIAIVLRRRAPQLSARVALAALAIFVTLSLGFGLAHAAGLSPASASHRMLAPLANWPLQAAVLIAAASHALVRGRLLDVATQLREGWWAAAPLEPRSQARALWLVAGAVAAVLLGTLLVLAGLLAALGARASPGLVVTAILAGVLGGAVTALLAVSRRPRVGRMAPRIGIRRPLFATIWLDDRHLPHLADWQRREALLRWRTGTSAMPVLAALLLFPSGASSLMVAGMLLFALSAGWLGTVLRGCIEVTATASQLLRSTPMRMRRLARAALRYPTFACACAFGGGLLVSIAAGSWALMAGWLAVVALLAIPALPTAWRLARDLRNNPG